MVRKTLLAILTVDWRDGGDSIIIEVMTIMNVYSFSPCQISMQVDPSTAQDPSMPVPIHG